MELEFELPKPLAFMLAEPWMLYKGRIYQPASSVDELVDNYIELGNKKFPLEEIESAKGLEDLYFIKNAQQIEQCEQEFMQSAANTEYRSRDTINQELSRNKVQQLLVTKVLPIITNFNADDQLAKMIDEENGIAHNNNFIEVMAENAGGRTRTTARDIAEAAQTGNMSPEMRREIQEQKRNLTQGIQRQYRGFEHHPRRNRGTRTEEDSTILNQLSAAINDHYGNQRAPRGIRELHDRSIMTSHIFPDRNLMFYDNRVHDLVTPQEWISYFEQYIDRNFYRRLQRMSPSKDPSEIYDLIKENKGLVEKRYLSRLMIKMQSSKVKIDGNYFFPIQMEEDSVSDIEQLYKKLIEKEVKLKAIEHNEFQAMQMYEIQKQREQLSRIANLDKFEMNGSGYEIIDRTYYAYVTTPEYCLKSPHVRDAHKYLVMPPAKIGVAITYQSGNFTINDPIVMNEYRHPFLSQRGRMQQICLGDYDSSRARRQVPEECVMTLLSKAKENILMGYRTGSNPYRKLTKESWRDGWITKREMQRRNLLCLNDFSD